MSILVVRLVQQGLLLGADRNVTSQSELHDGHTRTIVSGQLRRPKVFKWPNRETLIGFVGQGLVEQRPTDEWLYSFMGQHLEFDSLQEVAKSLVAALDKALPPHDDKQPMIVHLAASRRIHKVPRSRASTSSETPPSFFTMERMSLETDSTALRSYPLRSASRANQRTRSGITSPTVISNSSKALILARLAQSMLAYAER